MKPVFKQINDKLYLELDKHVYLTEDSFKQWNKHNLGVVVRLIQDESQMGKRNKLRFTKEALDDIDIMLGIDQFVQATFGSYVVFNIYCYEILGYIVKPNSAEWALYQMMNGLDVYYLSAYHPNNRYSIKDGAIVSIGGRFSVKNIDEWIPMASSITDWYICDEPSKPEYKFGDWVEHNDSKEQAKITHIASKNYDAIEVKFIESGELEVYSLYEMNKEFHAIAPKEVVLDFGGGIKGKIKRNRQIANWIFVFYGDYAKSEFHVIDINPLTDPMKTIVQELLKAQEEANE